MFVPEDEKNVLNDQNKYPYDIKDVNGYEYTISLSDKEEGTLQVTKKPVNESMPPWGHSDLEYLVNNSQMNESKNHLWKYNEDKILKDIQEYVTSTYRGHYCGDENMHSGIQTIDLMAAKGLAPHFCQANILKYGSRYGDKEGRNKRDLMKVIHYAMLLLHFDGHYNRQNNGLSEFSR